MIVSCPSCATRYDLPESRFAGEGTLIRCAACGHSWMEGRAVEVIDIPARLVPAVAPAGAEPEREIRRLVEASREAQLEFAARRRKRSQRLRRWAIFAACLMTPFAAAAASPETAVKLAPASIRLYEALGMDVNIYGLTLRRIETRHMMVDGTRVLAIKGEIVNVAGGERKIPWLLFRLAGGDGSEVYRWTLDSGARPLKPGEATNFVTRVASPPEQASSILIRFAHADEIGLDKVP